jgi:predicted peptidase
MRRLAALLMNVTLALPALAASDRPGTGFVDRTVTVGGASHAFKVWVPPGFDRARRWPVILWLHGAGETGTDGVQQTEVGLGPALRAHPDRFPVLAVFPQAPPRQVWVGENARVAVAALDQTVAELGGDPDRIYLAGLSMGGYGTWELAFEDPSRYAAIVSVAGGIVPPAGRRALDPLPPTLQAADPYANTAARVKAIPAWLFHGADDRVVPVTESRQIVAALKRMGASPRYTEYAGLGHNIWQRTFEEPELPAWLLAQRRVRPPAPPAP